MNLREWVILYVKHKDVLARNLKDFKEAGNEITFQFKDHTLQSYALEDLTTPEVKRETLLVTLQTRKNIQFLIDNWKKFVHKDLTVVFANPITNEKWLVKPYIHERVSEGKIEPGIRSMAEGVTYV